MPQISVLMPAYNAEKYIEQAINSILNQTFKDFELIIVNDGSTDKTHQLISSFIDTRIKYYQNEGNKGLAFVRNRLIQLANCPFVALLDSDDIAEPNRLEVEYNFLKNQDDLDFISSSVVVQTDDGKQNLDALKFDCNSSELKINLLFFNPIVTSTVMFKKAILPTEIFREDYPPCEDYDLWVRMLLKKKGKILPTYLAIYRSYNTSVSHRKEKEARENRNKIIVNQLEYYFPNQFSKEEEQVHLSLVEFSLKNNIDDLPELQKWITKLLALNATFQHFDDTILKQVLYERILKKLLRLKQYNSSVYKTLRQFKKQLQPTISLELRKKEIAIFVFSFLHKQIISLSN